MTVSLILLTAFTRVSLQSVQCYRLSTQFKFSLPGTSQLLPISGLMVFKF